MNGMDTTDWSPNVDKFLDVKYDADTVEEGKALAKEALQAELGLPVSIPHSCLPDLCLDVLNWPQCASASTFAYTCVNMDSKWWPCNQECKGQKLLCVVKLLCDR